MNNLMDYVKVYNDWFLEEERRNKIKQLKKTKWDRHTFATYKEKDLSLSGDKELSVSYCEEFDNQYIMQRIWDAYYKYISELNNPVFNSWDGFMRVRYNKYEPGQTMAMHCDHIRTLFDGTVRGIPILTSLGLFNDNFKGGEFVILDQELKLKAGDMMVFPSCFLYPHMVKPVKSGIRYSCVSWCW